MALKASKKKVPAKAKNTKEQRIVEIETLIREKNELIENLNSEVIELKNEILSLQIDPFKVGDEVIYEVASGKSRKKTKCVLESDRGLLYVRPYKDNGELSSRRFMVVPPVHRAYSDVLIKA